MEKAAKKLHKKSGHPGLRNSTRNRSDDGDSMYREYVVVAIIEESLITFVVKSRERDVQKNKTSTAIQS